MKFLNVVIQRHSPSGNFGSSWQTEAWVVPHQPIPIFPASQMTTWAANSPIIKYFTWKGKHASYDVDWPDTVNDNHVFTNTRPSHYSCLRLYNTDCGTLWNDLILFLKSETSQNEWKRLSVVSSPTRRASSLTTGSLSNHGQLNYGWHDCTSPHTCEIHRRYAHACDRESEEWRWTCEETFVGHRLNLFLFHLTPVPCWRKISSAGNLNSPTNWKHSKAES